jgi:hypothetical protein
VRGTSKMTTDQAAASSLVRRASQHQCPRAGQLLGHRGTRDAAPTVDATRR